MIKYLKKLEMVHEIIISTYLSILIIANFSSLFSLIKCELDLSSTTLGMENFPSESSRRYFNLTGNQVNFNTCKTRSFSSLDPLCIFKIDPSDNVGILIGGGSFSSPKMSSSLLNISSKSLSELPSEL